MSNNKPLKKSIAQLLSYRDLMIKEKGYMNDLISNNLFQSAYDKNDFTANIEFYNDINNKITLLDYEIDTAMLSNEFHSNGETMSLKQAYDQYKCLKEEIDLYAGLKLQLTQADLTKFSPVINYDELTKLLIDSEKIAYSLNEKINKLIHSILVEVDMESLVL